MHMSPFVIFALTVIFAVCALAFAKGGPAERGGAIIVASTTVGVQLIHMLAPSDIRGALLLAIDGLIAGGFLMLALRYASLWLGGAMLLQAVQFSLHAYYLVTQQRRDDTYALINNLDSAGVLLCILIGTLLAWRRRSRVEK